MTKVKISKLSLLIVIVIYTLKSSQGIIQLAINLLKTVLISYRSVLPQTLRNDFFHQIY